MKKRETFRWLKMKKYAVYFLQEVHCTKDKDHIWSPEWGYSAIFSGFSSASAGVCVLFNNNFNFQILKSFSDPEGRFVMVDIKLESKILTLVNILIYLTETIAHYVMHIIYIVKYNAKIEVCFNQSEVLSKSR